MGSWRSYQNVQFPAEFRAKHTFMNFAGLKTAKMRYTLFTPMTAIL